MTESADKSLSDGKTELGPAHFIRPFEVNTGPKTLILSELEMKLDGVGHPMPDLSEKSRLFLISLTRKAWQQSLKAKEGRNGAYLIDALFDLVDPSPEWARMFIVSKTEEEESGKKIIRLREKEAQEHKHQRHLTISIIDKSASTRIETAINAQKEDAIRTISLRGHSAEETSARLADVNSSSKSNMRIDIELERSGQESHDIPSDKLSVYLTAAGKIQIKLNNQEAEDLIAKDADPILKELFADNSGQISVNAQFDKILKGIYKAAEKAKEAGASEVNKVIEKRRKTMRENMDRSRPLSDYAPHLRAVRKLASLPGIDQYINNPAKLNSHELPQTVEDNIENMISELTRQLDAENMIKLIKHEAGISEDESASHFDSRKHPNRQPFESAIKLSKDIDERKKQLTTIGRYLSEKYKYLSRQRISVSSNEITSLEKQIEKAGEDLLVFHEYAIWNIFADDFFDLQNNFNGISRNGKQPHVTPEALDFLRRVTTDLHGELGLSQHELYEDVLKATRGGNIGIIETVLINNQLPYYLRTILAEILRRRTHDHRFLAEKLQLTWRTVQFSKGMGVDIDLLAELNGYGSSRAMIENLKEYLADPKLNRETLKHLSIETEGVIKTYQGEAVDVDSITVESIESMNAWDIFEARNQHIKAKFGIDSETPDQIKDKVLLVDSTLKDRIPELFSPDQSFTVFYPNGLVIPERPVTITYPNKYGEKQIFVIFNTLKGKQELAMNVLHERMHVVHADTLETAIGPDAWERVQGGLKEQIADVAAKNGVELCFPEENLSRNGSSQVEKPEDVEDQSQEWGNLYQALIYRRLAVYGIVQTKVRYLMGKWSDRIDGPLSEEYIDSLVEELGIDIAELYKTGIPVEWPAHNLWSYLDPLNPMDGSVYIDSWLRNGANNHGQEGKIDLEGILNSFLGKGWFADPAKRMFFLNTIVPIARPGTKADDFRRVLEQKHP